MKMSTELQPDQLPSILKLTAVSGISNEWIFVLYVQFTVNILVCASRPWRRGSVT